MACLTWLSVVGFLKTIKPLAAKLVRERDPGERADMEMTLAQPGGVSAQSFSTAKRGDEAAFRG